MARQLGSQIPLLDFEIPLPFSKEYKANKNHFYLLRMAVTESDYQNKRIKVLTVINENFKRSKGIEEAAEL